MSEFVIRSHLQFDHVVHVVEHPEEVALQCEQRFGFVTAAGGEHPGFGTYNRLAYFGLSYLEWVGLKSAEVARESVFGRHVLHGMANGGGSRWFAFRTDRMDSVVAAWSRQGLTYVGPVAASRTRPDGRVLRWRMLFPRRQTAGLELPFLIEWEEDDETRWASLAGTNKGGVRTFGNSARIVALTLGLWNVELYQQDFERYFNTSSTLRKESTRTADSTGLVLDCGGISLFLRALDGSPSDRCDEGMGDASVAWERITTVHFSDGEQGSSSQTLSALGHASDFFGSRYCHAEPFSKTAGVYSL